MNNGRQYRYHKSSSLSSMASGSLVGSSILITLELILIPISVSIPNGPHIGPVVATSSGSVVILHRLNFFNGHAASDGSGELLALSSSFLFNVGRLEFLVFSPP